MCSGHSQFLIG